MFASYPSPTAPAPPSSRAPGAAQATPRPSASFTPASPAQVPSLGSLAGRVVDSPNDPGDAGAGAGLRDHVAGKAVGLDRRAATCDTGAGHGAIHVHSDGSPDRGGVLGRGGPLEPQIWSLKKPAGTRLSPSPGTCSAPGRFPTSDCARDFWGHGGAPNAAPEGGPRHRRHACFSRPARATGCGGQGQHGVTLEGAGWLRFTKRPVRHGRATGVVRSVLLTR